MHQGAPCGGAGEVRALETQAHGGVSMQPKITNETLEAYCYCPQKFHLKLRGEQGIKTEYELMRAELRASTKARAIKKHGAIGPLRQEFATHANSLGKGISVSLWRNI